MTRTAQSLTDKLENMRSYVELSQDMLPKGVSAKGIQDALDFLSPIVVLVHGSRVSHRKFSTKKKSDLDILCVSIKAAFWPLEELYSKAQKNLEKQNVKIDLSIVSYRGFLSIFEERTALCDSLDHGFSVLYSEENT